MEWWPRAELGWLGYLKVLPAFACMAVPLMFLVDWWGFSFVSPLSLYTDLFFFFSKRINRPYFEEQAQEVLRSSDLHDIPAYYSRKPGSGFWLLEFGNTFVGLIAVDTTNSKNQLEKSSASESKGTTTTTATIRHFYVAESFRQANIQEDLLQYAVKAAFSDSKVQRIEAFDSPLVPYLRDCLRKAGFKLDHNTKKVGLLGWSLGVRYLNRDEWKGE